MAPTIARREFVWAERVAAAAVMPAACCGMGGNAGERNHVPPRQRAGRPDSGSKLPAVHSEKCAHEIPNLILFHPDLLPILRKPGNTSPATL
jgi:hypothetical protein